MVQGRPGQQSAVVVHALPVLMQAALQISLGPAASGLGTHGPPQQSALVAHAIPALVAGSTPTQLPAFVQRGMPRLSAWHASGTWFTLPAQQLFSAAHWYVGSLQTAPFGRHAVPLSQRPMAAPAALLHRTLPFPPGSFGTPGAPQQSLSARQSSPTERQPLIAWQTSTPVAPNGAHDRLQHFSVDEPPQGGSGPPSYVAVAPPPQSVPAGRQFVAPGAVTVPHVPRAAPACLLHAPAQHSKSLEQTSLVWTQNEGLPQTPPLQVFEQHSPPVVQGLPEVLQAALSGVQVPPPIPSGAHVPPQQSEPTAHAPLSATHCLLAHVPPAHENVQHSLPVVQVAPGALQAVIGAAHFFEVPSQFAVQQSRLVAQSCPTSLQVAASARLPSVIASTKPSREPPSFGKGMAPSTPGRVASFVLVSSPESANRSTVSLPHPVKTRLAPTAPAKIVATARGSLRMVNPGSQTAVPATGFASDANFGRRTCSAVAERSGYQGFLDARQSPAIRSDPHGQCSGQAAFRFVATAGSA